MYSRGNYAELPTNDDDLETMYSPQDVIDVATNDTIRVLQAGTGQYVIHQFKNFTGIAISASPTWDGQTNLAPGASPVILEIYNQVSGLWEEIDRDDSSPIDTDFTLTAGVADLGNYKNTQQVVSCRVYQLGN